MKRPKGTGDFIDSTVEDTKLREFDWRIALFTFAEQWDLVLAAKWKRVSYIQKG